MKWYANLYIGESLQESREEVIASLERGEWHHKIYLITPAINGKDLLDIRSAAALARKGLAETLPEIVGIARGRDEAMRLACSIVEECYRQTGDVDIRGFLKI